MAERIEMDIMYKGKNQDILIGILLSLCSIFLFVIAVEVTVRVLYPNIRPSTAYDWSSRHKGYPLEKPAGIFRIVVLGDSYTFGQGVKREETFSKKLELLLNNLHDGKRYEVINLGFCGLNTLGELEVLTETGINPETWSPDQKYRGLAYKPDLLLLEFTLNDSSTSGRSIKQIGEFDDKWRKGEVIIRVNSGDYSMPLPDAVDKFLTKHSRFYLFLLNRYNQFLAMLGLREAGKSAVTATLNRYSDDFDGWSLAKNGLIAISTAAKENKIPIVVAVYPEMVELGHYPFKRVHEKITNYAASIGFRTLDLLKYFEGKDAKKLTVSPFDGHPNAISHEIAAKGLLEYLKNERLLNLN